jgi:hypothetical protein
MPEDDSGTRGTFSKNYDESYNLNLYNIRGAKGDKGSVWLTFEGAPTGTANEDDMALDKTNGNVYKYTNGSWVLICNIKGPQGQKGDKGETGSDAGWYTKTFTYSSNNNTSFTTTVADLTTYPMFLPYVKATLVLRRRSNTIISRTPKFVLDSKTAEVQTSGINPTISAKAYVFNNGILAINIELDSADTFYLDSCTISYLKL